MHQDQLLTSQILKLDYFRGLSALVVTIAHFVHIFLVPVYGVNTLGKIASFSALISVIGFFILSGYFISLSLDNNRKKNKEPKLFAYFSSRFARIYPPFIASLCLLWLISFIIHSFELHGAVSYQLPSDIGPLTRNYFPELSWLEIAHCLPLSYSFLGWGNYPLSNGPLWSLSYEVGFYILIGCLIGLIYSSNYFIKTLCFVIITIISYKVYHTNLLHFLFYFGAWFLGYFSYTLRNYGKQLALCGLLGLIVSSIYFNSKVFEINSYVYYQLPFVLILFIVLFSPYMFKLPLKKRVLSIANYSYSLYLCHFPLMLLSFSLIHPISSFSKFLYLISCACSFLLTLYISRHIASLAENKNWFAKKISISTQFISVKLSRHQ